MQNKSERRIDMTQQELYQIAKERYAQIGIDTEAAIEALSKVSI